MSEYPHGHVTLITALEEYLQHPEIIIIRGSPDEVGEWQGRLAQVYAPRRLVYAIPDDAAELPGALAERKPGKHIVAYRCTGTTCSLPISDWETLAAELSEAAA